jgi:hypothetical protein
MQLNLTSAGAGNNINDDDDDNDNNLVPVPVSWIVVAKILLLTLKTLLYEGANGMKP